jgi:5'-3' exonuclease
MAKIRQQRLRRFKSVWLAQKEREAGIRAEHTWDTNAITPGTEFMERLGKRLHMMSGQGVKWIIKKLNTFYTCNEKYSNNPQTKFQTQT